MENEVKIYQSCEMPISEEKQKGTTKDGCLSNEVNQLFEEQLKNWELARNNYKALEQVKVKTLYVNGLPYKVQYNPERENRDKAVKIESTHEKKPCFLCSHNLPAVQRGIPFKENYIILINPFPIFPQHLTIPELKHTPQLIASRFSDMLDLAQVLDNYTIFYNGPKCGASAPDHFHFQAGNKGFLPIESDNNWHNVIRVESENKQKMLDRFQQIYDSLPLQPNEPEPMLNILTWYKNGQWTTCIFIRKKGRPNCYDKEGDEQLKVNPASVELGGVFITVRLEDFIKITEKNISDILKEICV